MDNLEGIKSHLKRLYGHYITSIKTYNENSLKDLSVSLRLFTEYGDKIDKEIFEKINKNPSYKTITPSKVFQKELKDTIYFVSFLPDNFITYAFNEYETRFPSNQSVTTAHKFRINPDKGSMEVNMIFFAEKIVEETLLKKLQFCSNTKSFGFFHWLSCECIRVNMPSEGGLKILTRTELIKRVANQLGGSHIENKDTLDKYPEIKKLIEFKIYNLQIPYFVLMKITQQILTYIPISLNIEEYNLL